MKLQAKDKYKDGMDLGFTNPPAGTYIWEIAEGIDKWEEEDGPGRALRIPVKIDRVISGDDDAEGMASSMFINLVSKAGKVNEVGEDQVINILNFTGLLDRLVDKFGEDMDPMDETFLKAIKLKLPGNFIQCTHSISVRDKKEYMNWDSINPVGSANKAPVLDSKPNVDTPFDKKDKVVDNEDW